MEIKTKTMKRCELVTVSGKIDSANAPQLESTLVGLIKGGKRNLALNFREVTYISSAGLKALLTAQVKVRRRMPRGNVVISEISPEIHEILVFVGIDQLFDFYDSDTEAVGSF